MPKNSKLLSVAMQGSSLCLWALVDTDYPMGTAQVRIFGTGWENSDVGSLEFLGTVLDGIYVWHVFGAVI